MGTRPEKRNVTKNGKTFKQTFHVSDGDDNNAGARSSAAANATGLSQPDFGALSADGSDLLPVNAPPAVPFEDLPISQVEEGNIAYGAAEANAAKAVRDDKTLDEETLAAVVGSDMMRGNRLTMGVTSYLSGQENLTVRVINQCQIHTDRLERSHQNVLTQAMTEHIPSMDVDTTRAVLTGAGRHAPSAMVDHAGTLGDVDLMMEMAADPTYERDMRLSNHDWPDSVEDHLAETDVLDPSSTHRRYQQSKKWREARREMKDRGVRAYYAQWDDGDQFHAVTVEASFDADPKQVESDFYAMTGAADGSVQLDKHPIDLRPGDSHMTVDKNTTLSSHEA